MSEEAEFTGGFLIGKHDDSDSLDLPSPKSIRQQKNDIKRKYWLVIIGLVFVYAGYNSYLTLQSSIHVEGGLGELIDFLLHQVFADKQISLEENFFNPIFHGDKAKPFLS